MIRTTKKTPTLENHIFLYENEDVGDARMHYLRYTSAMRKPQTGKPRQTRKLRTVKPRQTEEAVGDRRASQRENENPNVEVTMPLQRGK